MSRMLRVLLLGASLTATLGVSGCYVEDERHHRHYHGYYGHREYRCYGDDCRERRYW
jgi:hypothetical protein